MTITLSADINIIELLNLAEVTREFTVHRGKLQANVFRLTAPQSNKMLGYMCHSINIKKSQKKTMNVDVLLNGYKMVQNTFIVPLFITELKHRRVVNQRVDL